MEQKGNSTIRTAECKLFWLFSTLIVIFIGLYIYFVSSSIVNVVLREEIEVEVQEAHTRLSELETHYLSLKDGIDYELALSIGFTNVTDKQFVTRKTLSVGSITNRE